MSVKLELFTDGKIYADAPIRMRELIKTVPGTTWNAQMKMWTAPLSWAVCLAFGGIFGDLLEVGPALKDWVQTTAQRAEKLVSLRTALEEATLMAEEPDLYPFQRVGVQFLTSAGRALLADDMGSGKTIQLIRAVDRLGPMALPVLVVCPNSMKYTWKEEIEKWSDLTAAVVDGTAAKRRKAIEENADFTIINWESLRLHSRLSGYGSMSLNEKEKTPKELNGVEWGTIIADEAHRAKDPKSKQTRALWAVANDVQYRFAATGTPIESNPGEMWSILHFLTPKDFPGRTKFIDRYCLASANPFGGLEITGLNPTTATEFRKAVEPRMIRRPKEAILPQLPPKVTNVRYVTMGAKQERAYKGMADSMIAELKDGELAAALNPLAQFIRLSQFASAFAELNEEDEIRLAAPSNKVEAFLDILEESGTKQVVAFAESKQLIMLAAQRLEKEGISFGKITGDESVPERQVIMQQFQAGQLRAVLCTSAGAEGITLTAAPVLVFMQRFWSSIKNQQAADRIHRIGQEADHVDIITLASKGTVDEYRETKLDAKNETIQELLQDEQIMLEMLKWGRRRKK